MNTYLYELPTTGAISFADFCVDTTPDNAHASHIAEATQARANLRGALKEIKRVEGADKDYLRLIKALEDYLPQLYGIISCIASGEIRLRNEPMVSWRTTLSSSLFHTSPRLSLPSLHADLASSILTYGMALSNFARSTVRSLGTYERERAISDKERKEKDSQLEVAVKLLCRASGVFQFLCDDVLVEWEKAEGGGGWTRPPDLSREVNSALAKMALVDAQTLAIRKLLSKSAFDSTLSPGPPLPKSHPSTALIAKLHLECAALYESARGMAAVAGKARASNMSKTSKLTAADGSGGTAEVSPALLKHLSDATAFHTALAHKWLGVDAGENGGQAKGGEAVGFLTWAKRELEELEGGGVSLKSLSIGKDRGVEKEKSGGIGGKRKGEIVQELHSVKTFLTHYKKINDSLTFQPVPPLPDLQARIPTGRLAVTTKPYAQPVPAFGPGLDGYSQTRVLEEALVTGPSDDGSLDHIKTQAGGLKLDDDSSDSERSNQGLGTGRAARTYAGAGSYF
ncbi:BRO1-like domain-containing protein [Phlebopus sp. FC_14]|nr:BRO1-like domain-containing protein [Phlebopus sp. FC_14]